MPNRALIIAIENYKAAQGTIAAELPGVHASARRFFDWLIGQKLVEPQEIFVCSDGLDLPAGTPTVVIGSNPPIPLHFGGTQTDIITCIRKLLLVGTNQTENLFVYCAGHGFAYASDQTLPGFSFLITSEFTTPEEGGGACINIDQLQRQLSRSFSGRRHFHFIDACRNLIPAESIRPAANLPIVFPASNNGQASCFVVYSTRLGDVAAAGTEFSDALVAGLSGFGYGKQWVTAGEENELWVTFDGVNKELKRALNRDFDRMSAGAENDAICRLDADLRLPCTIRIEDANAAGEYDLVVRTMDIRQPSIKIPATGFRLDLRPSVQPYSIELSQNGVPLQRIAPDPGKRIDMYLGCELVFKTRAPGDHLGFHRDRQSDPDGGQTILAPEPPPSSPNLEQLFPERDVRADHGRKTRDSPTISAQLRNETTSLRQSRAARAIEHALFYHASASEKLKTGLAGDVSPVTLLAATAIALACRPASEWTETVRKNIGFDLPAVMPTETLVLLLVLADSAAALQYAIHDTATLSRKSFTPAKDIPGIYFAWELLQAGAHFVTLFVSGKAVKTYATHSYANFITVVSAQLYDVPQVQQFFPPSTVQPSDAWLIPRALCQSGTDRPRDLVRVVATGRVLARAEQAFLERKAVWKADFLPSAAWDALLDGTWTNQEMLVLCALDASRQGRQDDLATLLALPDEMGPLAGDLGWFRGQPVSDRLPVLLDTLLMAEGTDPFISQKLFPFRANDLNYRDMWIAWRAAL